MVWAIASREDASLVQSWVDYFDIGVPVLIDSDGATHAKYQMAMPFPTGAYPQEWVIDQEGNIAHLANRFDHDELTAVLDGLLAE